MAVSVKDSYEQASTMFPATDNIPHLQQIQHNAYPERRLVIEIWQVLVMLTLYQCFFTLPSVLVGKVFAISAQLLPASLICFKRNSSAGVQGVLVRLFLAGGGAGAVPLSCTGTGAGAATCGGGIAMGAEGGAGVVTTGIAGGGAAAGTGACCAGGAGAGAGT